MRSALLVSDMFGRGGDGRYLSDWSRWLAERHFAADVVMVDDLLFEVYPFPPGSSVDHMHALITRPEACGRASARLRERIAAQPPELLLGFSFGGYLAYGARDALPSHAALVCLSTTRLRHVLPIDSPPRVDALFGDADPNRPDAAAIESGGRFLSAVMAPGAGHDVYRDVLACAAHVERALSAPRP